MLVLLYECTAWTLTESVEKTLDENYMLQDEILPWFEKKKKKKGEKKKRKKTEVTTSSSQLKMKS